MQTVLNKTRILEPIYYECALNNHHVKDEMMHKSLLSSNIPLWLNKANPIVINSTLPGFDTVHFLSLPSGGTKWWTLERLVRRCVLEPFALALCERLAKQAADYCVLCRLFTDISGSVSRNTKRGASRFSLDIHSCTHMSDQSAATLRKPPPRVLRMRLQHACISCVSDR